MSTTISHHLGNCGMVISIVEKPFEASIVVFVIYLPSRAVDTVADLRKVASALASLFYD